MWAGSGSMRGERGQGRERGQGTGDRWVGGGEGAKGDPNFFPTRPLSFPNPPHSPPPPFHQARVVDLEDTSSASSALLAQTQAQNAALQLENQRLKIGNQRLERERDEALSQVSVAKAAAASHAAYAASHAAAVRTHDETKATLDGVRAQNTAQTAKLKEDEYTISDLVARYKKLTEETEILRTEAKGEWLAEVPLSSADFTCVKLTAAYRFTHACGYSFFLTRVKDDEGGRAGFEFTLLSYGSDAVRDHMLAKGVHPMWVNTSNGGEILFSSVGKVVEMFAKLKAGLLGVEDETL